MSQRDRANAAWIGRQTADASRRVSEMAVASTSVISERLAMGAEALRQPSFDALVEANAMVVEKAEAGLAASAAVARSTLRIAGEASNIALRESSRLGGEIASLADCRNPLEVGALQGEVALRFYRRLVSHGLTLSALTLDMGSAALDPYHVGVVANARRFGAR